MKKQTFLLGVTYWPQNTAMFMWREFNSSSVKEDMATISDLGFSCVRVVLLWEDFQPKPRSISTVMLDRLARFLEIAGDRNLAVMVSLFTGHLGGVIWLPPWMLLASTEQGRFPVFSLDKVRLNKIRNPYSDPGVMEAQIFFLREVMNAVSGHPALCAWNLGNEPCLWSVPPDQSSATLWLQAMTETLKEKNDDIPVTMGLHVDDVTGSSWFTPKLAATYLDFLGIHVHPYHLTWAEGPLDTAVVPFLGCITKWMAKKPVLIQEFGVPTIPILQDIASQGIRSSEDFSLVNEDDVAEFAEKVLTELRRFKMIGGFWKSYGDYHPSIWNWAPVDRNLQEGFFGVLRHDGSPKPIAAAFKSAGTGGGEAEISLDWLDTPEEDFYQHPKQHLVRLYQRFKECYSFT